MHLPLNFSYNLIPLALSAFVKAFSLPCSQKGQWPYMFTELKRFGQKYRGLPSRHYYQPNSMTTEHLAVFNEWYNSHDPETFEFDFTAELERYCKLDVEILYRGLLAYRSTIMKLTTWDALVVSPTLPSLTSHILRCNHLPDQVLCQFPESGFDANRNQSS